MKALSKWPYYGFYIAGARAYHEGKGIDACRVSRGRLGMRCSWLAGWYDAQTEQEGWRDYEL